MIYMKHQSVKDDNGTGQVSQARLTMKLINISTLFYSFRSGHKAKKRGVINYSID